MTIMARRTATSVFARAESAVIANKPLLGRLGVLDNFQIQSFYNWDTRRSLKQSKAFAEDQRKFQLNAL